MIDALPPPEILAHLNGPTASCVISYQPTDSEAGDVTSARCGKRRQVIARHYHGDSVRRLSGCAIMLMIEGVRFPRLFHVDNCQGPLQVREAGKEWTQQLLGAGRVAPARLDRVIYDPVAHRPACYRVSVWFTPPGKTTNASLDERSAMRCAGGVEPGARGNGKPL